MALAPLGALAAIVAAALITRDVPTALLAYAAGGVLAGLVGALLGGLGGAVRQHVLRRRRARRRVHPATTGWVLHRSSGAPPLAHR